MLLAILLYGNIHLGKEPLPACSRDPDATWQPATIYDMAVYLRSRHAHTSTNLCSRAYLRRSGTELRVFKTGNIIFVDGKHCSFRDLLEGPG